MVIATIPAHLPCLPVQRRSVLLFFSLRPPIRVLEMLFETQIAESLNYSPYGIQSKINTDRIFDGMYDPTLFIVVRKGEMQGPSSSALKGGLSAEADPPDASSPMVCVLTLRPLKWVRRPGGEGAPGDPYERASERDSWRVAIENPEGGLGLYIPRARRPEDIMCDLVIEVAVDKYVGAGHLDKHLKQVQEGQIIWAFGPVRETPFRARRLHPSNNHTKSSLQISNAKR
jgi:hypothetical protein